MAKRTEKKRINLVPLFVILLAVGIVLFLHWQKNSVPWYGEALTASTEDTEQLSSPAPFYTLPISTATFYTSAEQTPTDA